MDTPGHWSSIAQRWPACCSLQNVFAQACVVLCCCKLMCTSHCGSSGGGGGVCEAARALPCFLFKAMCVRNDSDSIGYRLAQLATYKDCRCVLCRSLCLAELLSRMLVWRLRHQNTCTDGWHDCMPVFGSTRHAVQCRPAY